MDETTRHLIQVIYDDSGIKKYSADLRKAQGVGKTFGYNITKDMKFMGTKVSTSWNKLGQVVHTKTMIMRKGAKDLAFSWKEMGKNVTPLGVKVNKASQAMSKFGTIMGKAIKRAMVVAPVWLALRSAMMFLIRTIGEGLKYWVEWDKALMKAKAVIHDVTGDIRENFQILREEVQKLAIETGESMTKLTSAFYRFGTVGLNFEESMAGMRTATDLSIAMFGNADQIARVLAQTYRLLGKTMDDTYTAEQKMNIIGAQLYKLWQTNAFEINEMMGALQRFLPTANTFNFTMTETLGLLATLQTAGLKGTRAGRLLRTSINKLVSNLDDAGRTLGITVNPQLDSTFDILMKVLGAVKKMREEGGDISQTLEAMGMFGGVRSRQAGLALIALYETLLQNQDAIRKQDMTGLMQNFAERVEEVNKSIGRQSLQIEELRKQAGMTFQQMVWGGEEFVETQERLITTWKTLIWLMEKAQKLRDLPTNLVPATLTMPGLGLHNLLGGLGAEGIFRRHQKEQLTKRIKEFAKDWKSMTKKELGVEELKKLKVGIKFLYEKGELQTSKARIKSMLREVNKEIVRMQEDSSEIIKDTSKEEAILSNEIKQRLVDERNEVDLLEMELLGLNKRQIAEKKLHQKIKEISSLYTNNLAKEQKTLKNSKLYNAKIEEISNNIKKWLTQGEEGLLQIKEQLGLESYLNDLIDLRADIEKERYEERAKMIQKAEKAELQMLKNIGASELQILDAQERIILARSGELSDVEKLNLELGRTLALQNRRLQREKAYLSILEKMISAPKEKRQAMESALTALLPYGGGWGFEQAFQALTNAEKEQAWQLRALFNEEQKKSLTEAMADWKGISIETMRALERAITVQPEMNIQKIRAVELTVDTIRGQFEGLRNANPLEQPISYVANARFGNINITVNRETATQLAEYSGKKLTEILKNSSEYRKLFNKLMKDYRGEGAFYG